MVDRCDHSFRDGPGVASVSVRLRLESSPIADEGPVPWAFRLITSVRNRSGVVTFRRELIAEGLFPPDV